MQYDVKTSKPIEFTDDNKDAINPSHYIGPECDCGKQIECINITETMSFCRGNAFKYLWRAGSKQSADEVEDLRKAIWYIEREIRNLESDKLT